MVKLSLLDQERVSCTLRCIGETMSATQPANLSFTKLKAFLVEEGAPSSVNVHCFIIQNQRFMGAACRQQSHMGTELMQPHHPLPQKKTDRFLVSAAVGNDNINKYLSWR
jgi:hypothetical protein